MTPRHGEVLVHLARELLARPANRALFRRLDRQPGASWRVFRQGTILLIRLSSVEYGLRPWKGFLWSPLTQPDLDGSVFDETARRGAVALLPAKRRECSRFGSYRSRAAILELLAH